MHGSGLGADVGSLLFSEELDNDAIRLRYFYYNHRGDVSDIVDATGAQVASYRYDAFGQLIDQVGSADNDLLFSSKRYGFDTGLSYFGARYYDASVGRFISRDPMEYVDGPNQYILATNNPLFWIDPWGYSAKMAAMSQRNATQTYASCGSIIQSDFSQPSGEGAVKNAAITPIKDVHYSRNQYNSDIPETKSSIDTEIWVQYPKNKSIFHQIGEGNENNIKFVSLDGKQEAVYKPGGELVNDPVNMGTYNFSSPKTLFGIPHTVVDIVPYLLWGNSENDSTTVPERIMKMNDLLTN